MFPGNFRLLAGLGNPGSKYSETRHNIGFMSLVKLAEKESIDFRLSKKLYGHIAQIGTGEKSILMLMPDTYMNESGKSIRAALDWFDLSVEQLLVIVDDMDLPLGRLRVRSQGSSGGHNGLRSIINHLGTQNFCRLKIGIGAPSINSDQRKAMTISHVLGRFSEKEIPIAEQVINEVIEGLDLIQSDGIIRAGNRLNCYQPKDLSA